MLLSLLSLLSLSAFAADPLWPDLSTASPIGGGEKDAAVVVAIEDYAVVSDIAGAKSNGLDWYTWLTEGRGVPASRVTLLTDNEGVRERILDATEKARAGVLPGGTLWFVFIGHGAPGENGQDGVLIGWDTQQNAQSVYARGVPQSMLRTSLQGGAQTETVLVIDACFSGQDAGGAALVAGLQPMIPTYAMNAGGATVLSAGRSDEFAGPLPGADRPAFSYLVLGAVHGWGDQNQDGQVSAQEAVDYARGALDALPTGRNQTPQLTARRPELALGSGSTAGPKLTDIRKALAGSSDSSDSSGGLSDTLAELKRLQEEERRRKAQMAQLEAQVQGEIEDKKAVVQREAQQMWAQVIEIADGGGDAGKKALQAFVDTYADKTVTVGGEQYPVDIPEVKLAQARLSLPVSGSPGLHTLHAQARRLEALVGMRESVRPNNQMEFQRLLGERQDVLQKIERDGDAALQTAAPADAVTILLLMAKANEAMEGWSQRLDYVHMMLVAPESVLQMSLKASEYAGRARVHYQRLLDIAASAGIENDATAQARRYIASQASNTLHTPARPAQGIDERAHGGDTGFSRGAFPAVSGFDGDNVVSPFAPAMGSEGASELFAHREQLQALLTQYQGCAAAHSSGYLDQGALVLAEVDGIVMMGDAAMMRELNLIFEEELNRATQQLQAICP
ncbi:MAG: hypothetical protein AAFV53_31850 [Myxococcota bacterium]